MNKTIAVLALLLCFTFPVIAQQDNNEAYKIDASQRPGTWEQRNKSFQSLSVNNHGNIAVLVNKKMYSAAVLPQLIPYLNKDNRKSSVKVLKDAAAIRTLTDRPGIDQVMQVRLSRRDARLFSRSNKEFSLE